MKQGIFKIAARFRTSAASARGLRRAAALLLLGLPLGGALFAACASEIPKATLAEGCSINTDCDDPLVCAFKRCHNQCTTSRDCTGGQRCIQSDRPYRVCQQGDEQACKYNSECHEGEICGIDGQCRDRCLGDVDCIPGQICVTGSCADTTELVDGGLTPADDSGAPAVGQPCSYNSDCKAPLVCRGGACAKECILDVDCPHGTLCVNSLCLLPSSDAGPPDAPADAPPDTPADGPPGYLDPCNLPSDCLPPLHCGLGGKCVFECNQDIDCALPGTCCLNHACTTGAACVAIDGGGMDAGDGGGVDAGDGGPGAPCSANFDCDDGLFCNGVEQCALGHCAPALDTPCNSHSACIADFCAEGAPGMCTHQVQAGMDVDGDGHLALGCVGGDDCNDADPTVHGGGQELCDGKDNDCDGHIDDSTTEPAGATFSVPGTFYSPSNAFPRVAPLAGGKWLALGTNVLNANLIAGKRLDASGNAELTVLNVLPWSYLYDAIPSGSDVLVVGTDPVSGFTVAAVVHGDLTTTTPVVLSTSYIYNANGAWTGNRWIVAFSTYAGTAQYGLIDTAGAIIGSVLAVPTTVLGNVAQGSYAYGVSSGGSPAVVYQRPDGTVELTTLNPFDGGAQNIVPLPWLGSGGYYGVTGTSNGYGAYWYDGTLHAATFQLVLDQMVNQATLTFPLASPTVALVAVGTELAFTLNSGGQPYYGYWRGTMADPVELVPLEPVINAGYVDITYADGRLAPAYVDTTGKVLTWRRAGCP